MRAPDRCAGIVVEMPVLGRGRGVAKTVFSAMARALEMGGRPLGTLTRAMSRLPTPRSIPEVAAFRDVMAADPVAGAALLRGLIDTGALPDDDPARLDRLTMPALVIGHRRDPLHVLDDARDLAARLPRARFVEASSILEFRLQPEKLAVHVREMLAEVWTEPGRTDA